MTLDTSDYPGYHTFLFFSPDSDISAPILQVIETASKGRPRPARDAIEMLLVLLSRAVYESSQDAHKPFQESHDIDDDDDEDLDDYDIFDDFVRSGASGKLLNLYRLQQ